MPGRAGGGGRAGVLLLWAAVGLGAGFINGLLGAAGGILLVTALPYLPTPHCCRSARTPTGRQVRTGATCSHRHWRSCCLFRRCPPCAIGWRASIRCPDPCSRCCCPPPQADCWALSCWSGHRRAVCAACSRRSFCIRHPDAVLRGIGSCCLSICLRPSASPSCPAWESAVRGCLSCT